MNLSNSLAILRDYVIKVESIEPKINSARIILEDKSHIDHPEDLVFLDGVDGAKRAIQLMIETSQKPEEITIKFDGYPALIFGKGEDGKFSIMDKHMFNKKDGSGREVYNPQQFLAYDKSRDADRGDLYKTINTLWAGLEASSDDLQGYIWGDLLFRNRLDIENGLYKFRANPKGITYTVEPNSEIGKLIADKDAGIVVHQFISPNAISTEEAESLNGTIGPLRNVGNVAIIASKLPVRPNLGINQKLIDTAYKTINKYEQVVSEMLADPPISSNSFRQLFTVFINKCIVAGDLNNLLPRFIEFYKTKSMSDNSLASLDEYFQQHRSGLSGIFHIWARVYHIKVSIVNQLNNAVKDSPIKGYLDNGTQTQEGFVSQGLKFVDRMGFSRQNLAGR